MAKKSRIPNFDQVLDALRSHSFDVSPCANGTLVSKYGAAAVLNRGTAAEQPTVFAQQPGLLVQGEVAQLLDRGYQKFFHTAKFELPATAEQLHAIHQFSEELKLAAGVTVLFNEALGTTSGLYEYDRLKGREAEEPAQARPWDSATNH